MATLIALIGAPGAGKSTLAGHRWPDAVHLSLDGLRAEVCGDETDQDATPAAVALLHERLDLALSAGTDVVVDATNAAADPDRAGLLAAAARNGAVIRAVVIETPLHICLGRNAVRPGPAPGRTWGRRVPPVLLAKMHADIADLTDAGLRAEGFAAVDRIAA
jgi:predicted kinase